MTTTTKQQNSKTAKDAIGDGWDDAAQVSGGESGPDWQPHFVAFNADVIAHKLSQLAEGSHARGVIVGSLAVAEAYNEPRYFVDEEGEGGKITRIALPRHNALTGALDKISLQVDGKPVRVRLAYKGQAATGKAGQNAPYLYDVRALPKAAMLTAARKDALMPIHKENKAKRDAAEKAAEEE